MNNENLLTSTKKGRALIAVGVIFGVAILTLIILIATGVIKIDRNGGIVARFEPTDMKKLKKAIEEILWKQKK